MKLFKEVYGQSLKFIALNFCSCKNAVTQRYKLMTLTNKPEPRDSELHGISSSVTIALKMNTISGFFIQLLRNLVFLHHIGFFTSFNKPFSQSFLKTRQEIENEANTVRIFLWPVIKVKKPYSSKCNQNEETSL